MEKKKPTKKECLEMLRGIPVVAENADLVRFIDNELLLLDNKKNSTSKKRIDRQKENDRCREVIYDTMLESPNRLFSLPEIIEFHGLPSEDFSAQRATYILTKLVDEGLIEKTKDKKKRYYKVLTKHE